MGENFMSEIQSTASKVLLAIPAMDGKIFAQCVSGLIQTLGAFAPHVRPYFHCGQSNIRLCRNEIADYFMNQTDCDTLVWVDSDIGFTAQDFAYLLEGEEELVWAPYARKRLGMPPVDFGFGFVRTSRSVFEKLGNWLLESGEEALHRFRLDGRIAVDYFFDGATPDMKWFSEDTGFFHWCALLQMSVRKETRTRLKHIGLMEFGYPEQIPGMFAQEDGAQ